MFNLNRKCREDCLDLSTTIRVLKKHGVVPVRISSEYYIQTPLYLDYAFEQERIAQRQRSQERSKKASERARAIREIQEMRNLAFQEGTPSVL